jgi:hypothetical protein
VIKQYKAWLNPHADNHFYPLYPPQDLNPEPVGEKKIARQSESFLDACLTKNLFTRSINQNPRFTTFKCKRFPPCNKNMNQKNTLEEKP